MNRVRLAALVATVALAGCASELPAIETSSGAVGAGSLVALLTREAAQIEALLGLRELLLLAALGLAGWLATRVVRAAMRAVWRLGLDPQRRLTLWGSAVKAGIAIWVLFLIVGQFLRAAPVITVLALSLALGALVVVLSGPIQNLWSAIALSFGRKGREGDRLALRHYSGVVREMGLTRVRLGLADGTSVYVPNRLVSREIVAVQPAKNAMAVEVRLELDSALSSEQLEWVRRTALVLPYRLPGSALEVEASAGELRVQVHVWSEQAVREAQATLRSRLAAALSEQAQSQVVQEALARAHAAPSDDQVVSQ